MNVTAEHVWLIYRNYRKAESKAMNVSPASPKFGCYQRIYEFWLRRFMAIDDESVGRIGL